MYFKPLGTRSPQSIKDQCADIYLEYTKSTEVSTKTDTAEYWQRVSANFSNYYVSNGSLVLAIGSYSVSRECGSAMLHNIVVKESEQRKGIGRFLIERLEREIAIDGIRYVELFAKNTVAAFSFYEAMKYQRECMSSNYFYKEL